MKRPDLLPPLDRVFRGVRIFRAPGVRSPAERTKRDQMLTYLRDTDRFDLWEAIAHGRLSIPEVYAAYRDERLSKLTGDLALHQNLKTTVEAWLPKSAPAASSRLRIEKSWKHFTRMDVLPDTAKVRDLEKVDWLGLKGRWDGGPHDWKMLRGMISRFLTVVLSSPEDPEEGQFHAFRRRIMARIPAAPKTQRVPDLNAESFWKVVDAFPEVTRSIPVALVLTGMRIGELCACTEDNLLPLTCQVRIPGKDLNTSAFKSDQATQPVDRRMWNWIERAIPVMLSVWTIRDHWREACKAVGVKGVTLHDLRHCYGQWLVNAGRSEESVQRGLRHKTMEMTRLYTTQRDRQANAAVIADVLIGSRESPHSAEPQASEETA